MKTIKLEPTEFYQFRKIALTIKLLFFCTIIHSVYIVEATAIELENLGY